MFNFLARNLLKLKVIPPTGVVEISLYTLHGVSKSYSTKESNRRTISLKCIKYGLRIYHVGSLETRIQDDFIVDPCKVSRRVVNCFRVN